MTLSVNDMKNRWKDIRVHGKLPVEGIKEEIVKSWQRSLQYAVFPFLKKNNTVLSSQELQDRRNTNKELMEAAGNTLHNLSEFARGSGFAVALADCEAVLLLVEGDEEAMNFAQAANFIAGAKWSEPCIGTNAVSLALIEGRPTQVYGYEHYCICAFNSTCSASPIRNSEGKIIGALDITGPFDRVHHHTLGMVVVAAKAIEYQLALRKALEDTQLVSQYNRIIMESISEGILAIDNLGYITHLNRAAEELLHLERQTTIGKTLAQMFGDNRSNFYFINLIRSSTSVTDAPISITQGHEVRKYNINCSSLLGNDNDDLGRVVVIQEYKRLNKLANKIVGLQARFSFSDLIGEDEAFINAISMAKAAASSNCNILLLGENGTGKDLFAHAIHQASIRHSQPFVPVNCGAIPRDLIASELFGYEEGAFTGAKKGGNPGKFELADGGTIFLNEIGEMPLDLQVSLLQILEESHLMRIGGKDYLPINVRIIAATNKDLFKEIDNGYFRKDLFYRLSVMVIPLPPLRERKDDIVLLSLRLLKAISKRLCKNLSGFEPEVLDAFRNYSWPGNIRELQNIIEQAVILANGPLISLNNLPTFSRGIIPPNGPLSLNSLREAERMAIYDCLKMNITKSQAAKRLGISKSTLYRKIKEYEISLNDLPQL